MKSPPKPPPENNPHNQTLKRPRGRPKGSRDRVPRQSRALEPEILRIIEALAERAAAAEQGREQRRRFLTPGSGYQPGNAQMFYGTK